MQSFIMPKRAPRNGYYYFMLYFREREEKAGRRFTGGLPQIAEEASSEWKLLPQQEKDDYNRYAKENRHLKERKNVPKALERKFNCLGVSYAELERRKEKDKRKLDEICNFIDGYINALDIDSVKDQVMHLIHVNIFCKTDDDLYYPAELAISKFSLRKGIIDTYHTFLNPGEIKTGYSLAVREHSERTHKLTLQFVQQNPKWSMYEKIYKDVCDFLKPLNNVPLFTMYDDLLQNTSLTAVIMTLEVLWQAYTTGEEPNGWKRFFPVYPLPLLFQKFKNKCFYVTGSTNVPFPNSSLAILELNRDNYNFEEGYGCEFHQKEDAIKYCSLSYVLTWAQIIREHCCEQLGLDLDLFKKEYIRPKKFEESETASSECNFARSTHSNDDDFEDCQSVCSAISSTSIQSVKTRMCPSKITFASASAKAKADSFAASEPLQPATVWQGRGRGRNKSVLS